MIGRGRVISLTPSGAHLGAGRELSDLSHPQPFQKIQRTATPPTRSNEKGRRPQEEVDALNRQFIKQASGVSLIPYPHDALAYAEHGSAPDCAARGQLGPAERNPAAGENGDVGPTHRCGSDPSAWRSTDTRSMQARAHDGSSGRGSSGACGSSDTARSRTRQDSRSSHTRRTS